MIYYFIFQDHQMKSNLEHALRDRLILFRAFSVHATLALHPILFTIEV